VLSDEKAALRRLFREKRNALSPEAHAALSLDACRLIQTLPLWQGSRTVLAYWPMGSELDIRPLLRLAWQEGKRLLLPRCVFHPRGLALCPVKSEAELLPGAYGIPEPTPGIGPVPPCQVDLALVPVVAMDEDGFRLGNGGGFYDRLLPRISCAYLVGFDQQRTQALPREAHDIRASGWITPTEWRKCP